MNTDNIPNEPNTSQVEPKTRSFHLQTKNRKDWKSMSGSEKAGGIVGLIVAVIIILGVIGAASGGSKTKSSTNAPATSSTTASAPKPAAKPAVRQVSGTATTLGAGTFTGGKDVAVGLYDVTPGAGQSGNFIVSGTDSYDEILGNAGAAGGVPRVRVKVSDGDQIQISSLSKVVFTPVTEPFVTTHTLTTIYAGTFTVGEDVGAGRYVATPGAGQSGNFIVDGSNSYDEILGNAGAAGGVPSLTVSLSNGDTITISSLSQVTLTPSN